MTWAFGRKVLLSGLTGVARAPIDIVVNQIGKELPKLGVLMFLGERCDRPMKLIDRPDSCPYCGAAPFICPDCGITCASCKEPHREKVFLPAVKEFQKPDPKKIRPQLMPPEGVILLGRRWDGSDFFSGGFITRRAVDWLLSVHAAPFVARPIRVCTDGMTAEQLRKLEEAKRPLPPIKSM